MECRPKEADAYKQCHERSWLCNLIIWLGMCLVGGFKHSLGSGAFQWWGGASETPVGSLSPLLFCHGSFSIMGFIAVW